MSVCHKVMCRDNFSIELYKDSQDTSGAGQGLPHVQMTGRRLHYNLPNTHNRRRLHEVGKSLLESPARVEGTKHTCMV